MIVLPKIKTWTTFIINLDRKSISYISVGTYTVTVTLGCKYAAENIVGNHVNNLPVTFYIGVNEFLIYMPAPNDFIWRISY